MRDALVERKVSIPAGVGYTQSHSLGILEEPKCEFRLRKLTVSTEFPYVEQILGTLTLPSGIVVGPIDVPFTFNVTSPVQVKIEAPVLASNQTVRLILADLPDSPNLYGATHFAAVGVGDFVAIPDACVAVTLLAVGQVLTFYNSAHTAMGNAEGSQLIARPRTAKFVGIDEPGGFVLFHY